MNASIIGRVSQIILENQLGFKIPQKPEQSSKENDRIEISSAASDASVVAKAIQEKNNDAAVSVKTTVLKEKVAANDYKLSEAMVENIAEKIAAMFL